MIPTRRTASGKGEPISEGAGLGCVGKIVGERCGLADDVVPFPGPISLIRRSPLLQGAILTTFLCRSFFLPICQLTLASLNQSVMSWLSLLSANPFLVLILASCPLLLIAYVFRIYPLPRLYFVYLPLVGLATVGLLVPWLTLPVLLLDLVFFAWVFFDLFTVAAAKHFRVERAMVRVASIAKPHTVELQLSYSGAGRPKIKITDDFPLECELDPPEQIFQFNGRSRSTFYFQVTPTQRGEFNLHFVYLCVRSRFGFWAGYHQHRCPGQLHVYPDLKQMSDYALLAKTNRLSLLGFRRSRRAGQENEFERLRDFTQDDQFKFIDWRASARRNKLTVRDFQVTQSQRVVFLLDCGRMMSNQSHGLTMLDHALNAALMLAYVALSRGDSAGLLCFSDKIECYVPPRGDAGQMNRLLHASYNVFPRMVESRYDEAFQFMKTKNPRRSLVILVTNLIDEINANQISQYVSNLHGKHLPLAVFLRDYHLFQPLPEQADQAPEDLYTAAAAADILGWRHQVMTGMVHRGALVLDAFPDALTAPLVNQYLEIKARQML